MKVILLAAAFLISTHAQAGDCVYRFSSSTEEIQVIPAGFTGLMTCNAVETKTLFAKVGEQVKIQLKAGKTGSEMIPSISVRFGKLSFYPALRAEIAKVLSSDAGWDKTTGKSKTDSMNDPLANAFMRSSFVTEVSQKDLMVDEAGVENISTATAAVLKIPGLKAGLYPQSAELKIVFHRLKIHSPTHVPAKKK